MCNCNLQLEKWQGKILIMQWVLVWLFYVLKWWKTWHLLHVHDWFVGCLFILHAALLAGGDQSHPCSLQAWWNAAFTDFYELKNEEPIQTADHTVLFLEHKHCYTVLLLQLHRWVQFKRYTCILLRSCWAMLVSYYLLWTWSAFSSFKLCHHCHCSKGSMSSCLCVLMM